jgi:hypothetical protein
MRRDVLSTNLRSLVTQAEAICAQLSATPAVTLVLMTTATPSEELQRQLREAATQARALAVERALAEQDKVEASYDTEEQVAKALAWRNDLRQELSLLRDACPALTHDAETVLLMTRERPRRLPALRAWLGQLDLQPRVVIFEREPEGARVVAKLQEAEARRADVEEVFTRAQAAREARAASAATVDAARSLLQQRIRLTRAAWALAQAQQPRIPDLDLTIVRGAAGRTTGTRSTALRSPEGSEATG